MPKRWRDWWIYAVLMSATFLVFGQVRHFDFVNFDDPVYVRDNPHVREGLTARSVAWAFTSGDEANWFPVTRLSHLLDGQLFGISSGAHHLVNVLIHGLAALLLFAGLRRATGARWPSAFVALIFAVDPLHVESVAWVSERKDVLNAFFWFLTIWCYVRYAERPSRLRYLAVAVALVLGLMAKPMIVTLPFVLLLLDAWPLQRFGRVRRSTLLWEKVPLVALVAVSAVVTFLVQRHGGAVESLTYLPWTLRLQNALVSYAIYFRLALWPTHLAAFYPYPASIEWWQPLLATLALAGATGLVLRLRKCCPYLLVGWFWYLGTLVPVIGLVQVGSQARADRYMYVPLTGLAIMAAWGTAALVRRRPGSRVAVAGLAGAACTALAVAAWVQTSYWRDSVSLFEHAIAVTQRNYLAHYNLAVAFSELPGRRPEAMAQLQAAIGDKPDYAPAHNNLGNLLSRIPGRLPDAIAEYRVALRLKPDYAGAHNNLASALEDTPGGLPEAVSEYEAALRLNPGDAAAHNNLGDALLKMGRLPEAVAQFQAALQLDANYAGAHNNLGIAFSRLPGRLDDAIAQFETAVRIRPGDAAAHVNLASALARIPGRLPEAIEEYHTAERIAPDSPVLHNNLGNALSKLPDRLPDAIAEYEIALRLKPDYADAHYALAVALAKTPGRMSEALGHFEMTLKLRPNPALQQFVDRLRASRR